MNIAIFDGEVIKALPIIRSLANAGYGIITFSFEHLSLGGNSRYTYKNIFLKGYNVEKIKRYLKKFNINIIFPLEDHSIDFFLKNRESFLSFTILMPEFDDFIRFNDKSNTIKYASALGIPVPETFVPESISQAEQYLKSQKQFPLAIKPRISTGSRGLRIVYSAPEALKQYKTVSRTYHLPIIQEYIPEGGKTVGVEFLYFKGKEILFFSHQRIREFPVKGGPSTFCTVYQKRDAIKLARKIFKGINYSGFAMVEFKQHPETKKFYLMEVNPRPWGSISLPIFAGVNFPVEAVKVFNQEKPGKTTEPKRSEKLYMRWLIPGDILSITMNHRIALKEKIKQLFRKYPETVYQIINKEDILPALTMILKMFVNFFNIKYIKRNLLRK